MTSDRPYRAALLARGRRRGAAPPRRHAVRPARGRRAARGAGRIADAGAHGFVDVRGLASARHAPSLPRRRSSRPSPCSPFPPQPRRPRPSPVLRLARRLLRRRLPALLADRRAGRPATGSPTRLVRQGPQARLRAQARQLRLRGRDQRLDPQAQDEVRRPRPRRRELRRPDPGDRGREVPAQAPRPGQADHGLDRRQRRHRAASRRPTRSPASARRWSKVKANGKVLLKRLRKAAGPKTRIVGITYPDVILGSWVGENPNQDLAKLSVVAFQSLLNPALKEMYESVGGQLRRRHEGHRRLHAARADDDARALRRDPRRRRRGLPAHGLLHLPRHPPEREGLRADRGPGREDAPAQALARATGARSP